MKRSLLSSMLRSFEIEGKSNQRPITYHVWTNSGGTYKWGDAANWHNNAVPTTNSNVLFADYSYNCAISGNISAIKSLNVRPTYTEVIKINSEQNLLVREDIRINGGDMFNLGRARLVTQSGNINVDNLIALYWADGIIVVSGGNAVIKPGLLYALTGFLSMYGSGVSLECNSTLPGFRLYGDVTVTGDSSPHIANICDLNGYLHVHSGNSLTVTSNKGKIWMNTGSLIDGEGSFIIERGAQFQTQNGSMDCGAFIVQDYDEGVPLRPTTYTAKNIIFRDSDGTDDVIIFGTGNYIFNGNVSFESSFSGSLEIQNDVYSPNLQFNKAVTLTGANFGDVVWSRGDGVITLGTPTGIEREYTRYSEGRTAVNRVDLPIGMAQGRATIFANMGILWIKDGRFDLNPLKLQTVHSAFHAYGTYTISGSTGIQLADLAIGPRPGGTGSHIYIGDFADSGCIRGGSGFIFRVVEPVMSGTNLVTGIFEKFTVTFTGAPFGETSGLARDVRAMMVGTGGDIYCISYRAPTTQLFKISGQHSYTGITNWRYMCDLNIPTGVVAADIASDGSLALIKTYNDVYYFSRDYNQTLDFMLTGTTPRKIVDYVSAWKEESMAIGSGGQSFYTLGQFNQAIHDPALRVPIWLYKKHEHIRFGTQHVERIVMNSPNHTKIFSQNSYTRAFAADYGIVHFSGTQMTTEGDFYVGPGANFDYRGLAGSILNVGGNYLIVGSANGITNLLNYSGEPPAYTNVVGTATVYWARVGNNNASGGSTVYSYFGNSHGSNVNWVFAPIESVVGTASMYLHQFDQIEIDDGVPMYLFGISDTYQKNFHLLLSGSLIQGMNQSLGLYMSGGYPNAVASIPLYMGQSGIRGTLPLVIRGTGAGVGEQLYLYVQNDAAAKALPLYVAGHVTASSTFPLYVGGLSGTNSGINLYLGAVGLPEPGIMKLYSHGRHASN